MTSKYWVQFTEDYFDLENGQYVDDYTEVLAAQLPSIYHVEDTWANYEKMRNRIDERYQQWKARKR